MGRLDGKVAIVTGAAMGLGLSIARLFADEGAKVVATDVKFEELKEAVSVIKNEGKEIIAVKQDVSQEDEWISTLEKTIEHYGEADILVNNASVAHHFESVKNVELDKWNQIIAINQTGTLIGMQKVIPHMQQKGKGSIINISSPGGKFGPPADGFSVGYSASKGAVLNMTRHAAHVLAPDSIRVNSVLPGFMTTPMNKAPLENDEIRENINQMFPLPPHAVGPIEVAYGVLYLASDEAAYVTGTELFVDGGFSSK